MFDYNMILLDGSVDYNAANDTPAISLTRDAATGAAVIDLGSGTPKGGLVACLIIPNDVNGATDTLTAYLQASDTVDMTGTTTGIERLGSFQVAAATTGVIVGSEVPCVALVHFTTKKRYVRLNGTVGTTPDDFGAVKCYITPFPFESL